MTREEYERHLENAIDAAMKKQNEELTRLRAIIADCIDCSKALNKAELEKPEPCNLNH